MCARLSEWTVCTRWTEWTGLTEWTGRRCGWRGQGRRVILC